MHSFRTRLVGPLMIGALALVGLGAPSAGAATGATTAAAHPAAVPGPYTMHVSWNGGAWIQYPLLLLKGHTGTAQTSIPVHWTNKNHVFKMTVTDVGASADYIGKKNRHGFNSEGSPGTMTNSSGTTGIWYAT